MNESMRLLHEGLSELDALVKHARRQNSLMYESRQLSAMEVLLLEAEDSPGFLKKATDAVKKIQAAAKAGIKEMKTLSSDLRSADTPMENSANAVDKAIADLESNIPGDSFFSKLGALNKTVLGALFGDDDDPVESVTKIIADAQTFKGLIGNVVDAVLQMLEDIEPVAVVDDAAEEAADEAGDGQAELTDEQKKEYIDQVKQILLSATIEELIEGDDNEMIVAIRETTGFSEKNIDDAIKKSAKPAKWFSQIKSFAGAFGFGIGGDLPLKQYGLTLDGLKEDLYTTKTSSLAAVAKKLSAIAGSDEVIGQTSDALKGLGAAKEEYQASAEEDTPAESGGGSQGQGQGQPAADGEPEAQPAEDPERQKYVSLAKSVNLSDPDTAGEKLQKLLAAGYDAGMFNWLMEHMSLNGILVEKAVRYQDVLSALEGHLPEDEAEAASAIRSLADEMKVELGTDFEIVGMPDQASSEIAALRSEIEDLRAWIETVPEELRPTVRDELKDRLSDAGADDDEVQAILDPEPELTVADYERIFSLDDAPTFLDLIDDPEGEVTPETVEADDDEVDSTVSGAIEAIRSSDASDEDKENMISRLGTMGAEFTKAMYANLSFKDLAVFIKAAKGDKKAQSDALEILGKSAGKTALTTVGVSDEDAEALVAVAAEKETGPDNPKKLSGKFKKGDSLPVNSYQEREDGEGWQAKAGKNTPTKNRQKKFKSEEGAKKHAMKEARYALAHMRGYILEQTGNFRDTSLLSHREVITEYYRLGGTNKKIVNELRSSFDEDRWATLAGVKK